MIRSFKNPKGRYIEKIAGQERLAYGMSGQEDFYDLIVWSQRGGYQGSVILFYDFEEGEVYQPFEKKRDVVYGKPVFSEGYYYFLQGDYGQNRITLFRYFPQDIPEPVTVFQADEVELYNLQIIGGGVHVISENKVFRCYYPEQFSFPLEPNETVCFMEGGKVYIEAWIEEGWDCENDRATDDYNYYHKVIVRDYDGKLLSEQTGALHQASDGNWWIS